MNPLLVFLIGAIFGGTIGFIIAAILASAGRADRAIENQRHNATGTQKRK